MLLENLKYFVFFFVCFDVFACNSYINIHHQYSCVQEDYPFKFGYKYCKKFKKEITPLLSEEGKRWSENTQKCLVGDLSKYLKKKKNFECSKIKKVAFSQHPSCYIQSGFCRLSLEDKGIIFNAIFDDFNWKFAPQVLTVLWRCSLF